QPLVQPHFFCHHLVHRQAGCHGPATCVRQLHEFKHSLKGSVLAISTVQGNKHSVKTSVDQVDERMGASVEQVGVNACTTNGLVDTTSSHPPHLPLGGMSTIQERKPAK